MEPVNVYDVELSRDDDDPKGYEAGYVRLSPLLGSERLGATVFELKQGDKIAAQPGPGGSEDAIRVCRESKVDYWDREVD